MQAEPKIFYCDFLSAQSSLAAVSFILTGLFLVGRNMSVPSPTPSQGEFFGGAGRFFFPLKNADLIKQRRLVKRRHTHVGAPDNRIEALYKEYVLTPRGRDMNPELGPVVAASPQNTLSYRSGL